MASLKLRWEATEPDLAEVFRTLSSVLPDSGFYLAGGTGLALQEGHRISIDLDLMSRTFSDPESLIDTLRRSSVVFEVTSTSARTLYVTTQRVQVSFFEYDYPQLQPVLDPGEGLLPLAHRDDIAAMKLAAIASRGSRKDFIDLWLLVSRHRSLREYLDCFRAKFEMRDIGHVVRSLSFFDDADEEPQPRMLLDLQWDRVKKDLLTWVSELLPE